jgi:hypothetical protein
VGQCGAPGGTRRLSRPERLLFPAFPPNPFSCFTKLARPPTPRSMVLVLPFCVTVAEQPFEQDSTSVAFEAFSQEVLRADRRLYREGERECAWSAEAACTDGAADKMQLPHDRCH